MNLVVHGEPLRKKQMAFPSTNLPKLDYAPLGTPVSTQVTNTFFMRGDPNNIQSGFSLSYFSPATDYFEVIPNSAVLALATAVNQAMAQLGDKVIFQSNSGFTSLEGIADYLASGNFVIKKYDNLTEWNNFRTSSQRSWTVPEMSLIMDATPTVDLTLAGKMYYPSYNKYNYHILPVPGLETISSGPVLIFNDFNKNDQNFTSPTCTTGENGPYFAYTVFNGTGVLGLSSCVGAGDVVWDRETAVLNVNGIGQRPQGSFPLILTDQPPTYASYGECLGISQKPHTFTFYNNLTDSYSWTADSTKDLSYTPNADGSKNLDFPSKKKIARLFFTDEHSRVKRLFDSNLIHDYSESVPVSDVTLRDFYVANGNAHFDTTPYLHWSPLHQMNIGISVYEYLTTVPSGMSIASSLPNPLHEKYEPTILKTLKFAFTSLRDTGVIKVLQSINDVHLLKDQPFIGILKVTEPVSMGEHQVGYGEFDPDTPASFFTDNWDYMEEELGSYVSIYCDGGLSNVLSPLGRPVSVIYVRGVDSSAWDYIVDKFTPNRLYSELTDITTVDQSLYQYPATEYKSLSLANNLVHLMSRQDDEPGTELVLRYEPELASKNIVTAWTSHGGYPVQWPDLQISTSTSDNSSYNSEFFNSIKFYLPPVTVETEASVVISGYKYDFIIPVTKTGGGSEPPPPTISWPDTLAHDFGSYSSVITNFDPYATYSVSTTHGDAYVESVTGELIFSCNPPKTDVSVTINLAGVLIDFVVRAAGSTSGQTSSLMNIVFAKVLQVPIPVTQGGDAYRANCMYLIGDPATHNVISIAMSTNTGDQLLFAPNRLDIETALTNEFSSFTVGTSLYTDEKWTVASQPLVQLVQKAQQGMMKVFSDMAAVSAAFSVGLNESFVFAVADASGMSSSYLHSDQTNDLTPTSPASVSSGFALFVFDASTRTVVKISEKESLDYVLTWTNIQDKPVSSSASIDSAVANRHIHGNEAILSMLSDNLGALQYNGVNVAQGLTFSW